MQFRQAPEQNPHLDNLVKTLISLLIVTGLSLSLCLVHRFAWSNFRSVKPSPGRVVFQLLAAFSPIGCTVALAIICAYPYPVLCWCSILYALCWWSLAGEYRRRYNCYSLESHCPFEAAS